MAENTYSDCTIYHLLPSNFTDSIVLSLEHEFLIAIPKDNFPQIIASNEVRLRILEISMTLIVQISEELISVMSSEAVLKILMPCSVPQATASRYFLM